MISHLAKLKTSVFSLALAFSITACASANQETSVVSSPAQKAEYSAYLCWLDALKKEMVAKGISQKTIDTVYAKDYYHPNPEIVKIDRRQAEFVLTSTDYLNRVVNQKRVEAAKTHYQQLQPFLNQLEEKYGVPGNYIIAFWGVETNFGSNFGGYSTIEALTTLSYDKRRSEFFKKELYHALKIIDNWHIDYTKMQGSWAGAMGHFQFMPSTFNAYAVDYDRDGQIDIWHTFEDAAASAANYLSTIGWKRGEPWGQEVTLPWNFNFADAGRDKVKSVKEWKKLGIKNAAGRQLLLEDDLQGSIIIPEGKDGNAYLIFDNFRKIMMWNRSENYALAIGTLSDYIYTGKPWKKAAENQAVRLKTDDIIKVQSFINKLGWSTLEEDGQLGSKTREAVKEVQKAAHLPQDGYPDRQLLNKINNYKPEIGFKIPVPQRKLHKKN